ncbi:MAG: phosphoribosylformylglycinamidine synthase subunit PurS [Coriobacteriales bacterium]|jgi:phosphoribosylformylglycinamidine synthase|nr:phosphoribosylformylglycinamidine synthase subunit PurS [Coriobacteriales bacterium]
MKRYRIYITAKQGIFDPAGVTAQEALANLDFAGVQSVRIGKLIELQANNDVNVEAVERMCQKLLANPIIEDFQIEEDEADL